MQGETGLRQHFEIEGRNFSRAGMISTKVKEILKEIGISTDIIRRTAIAAYEAEMNVVMYAQKGVFDLNITPQSITIRVQDEGPGIEDIELAMQEGFSTATDEIREMGFGAGMGLPNIKRNADKMKITSVTGKGTSLCFLIHLNRPKKQ